MRVRYNLATALSEQETTVHISNIRAKTYVKHIKLQKSFVLV